MTTLERKTYLKLKIDMIKDENILTKIEKLIEEEAYVLSEEQISRIEEARAEYDRGESISHETQQKEMEKWFESQEK